MVTQVPSSDRGMPSFKALDLDLVVADRRSGMSLRAIGKKYNTTAETIRKRLRQAEFNEKVDTPPRERRRMPQNARTSEQARAAQLARWSPESRVSEGVRVLIENAALITDEQATLLRRALRARLAGR